MKKILSLLVIYTFILTTLNFDLLADKDKPKKEEKSSLKKPEIVGVVDYISGKALIKKAGTKKWVKLTLKTKVTKADEIKTFDKSRVTIKLKDKKIVEIKPNTKIKISKLLKKAKKGEKEEDYGVTGVAGVRGKDASKKKEKVKSDELEWEE